MVGTGLDSRYPNGLIFDIDDTATATIEQFVSSGWAQEYSGQTTHPSAVPRGGDTGQALVKATGDDYDTGWGETSGSSSPVLSATVTVSSAQLLALADTPVQLVPAPGAGKASLVVAVVGVTADGATGYTIADNDLVATADENENLFVQCLSLQGALSNSGTGNKLSYDTPTDIGIGGTLGATDVAQIEDKPVMLLCFAASPTLGDASVTITTYYILASV